MLFYCLTKISIRVKRSISRVFSLFIVPSPFTARCCVMFIVFHIMSTLTVSYCCEITEKQQDGSSNFVKYILSQRFDFYGRTFETNCV